MPRPVFGHAQDDVNPYILRMLEGIFFVCRDPNESLLEILAVTISSKILCLHSHLLLQLTKLLHQFHQDHPAIHK